MHPLSLIASARDDIPNVELLRSCGWSVNQIAGRYCVAWRGHDEVVFEWRDGGWLRVGARGSGNGI